jgi:hypothetical protein
MSSMGLLVLSPLGPVGVVKGQYILLIVSFLVSTLLLPIVFLLSLKQKYTEAEIWALE